MADKVVTDVDFPIGGALESWLSAQGPTHTLVNQPPSAPNPRQIKAVLHFFDDTKGGGGTRSPLGFFRCPQMEVADTRQ